MSVVERPRPPRFKSAGPHFELFCRNYCQHTKGALRGTPLLFEPFQRRFWKEALQLRRDGKRAYSFVLSGRPRKNAKTTECAALGLYLAGPDGEPGPDVVVGSGTRDQAGFVFNQAKDFVDANPALTKLYRTQANVIIAPAFGGILKRISSEGSHQLGFNLSGAVIDELEVFESERDRLLYSAIVTSTAIREQPLIVSITTAGWNQFTLLGELYAAALELPDIEKFGKYEELTVARDAEAGFFFHWYGAPEGADIENRELWRAVNPLKAVKMEFLERQWRSPAISESEFRRFHLNQWVAAQERWIADHIWREGAVDLRLEQGKDVWLGVDAALTYDTTALAISQRTERGPILSAARVWSARPEVAHDVFVPGGRIDNSLVEEYVINHVAPRYRIRELVYDPRFFEETAQRLARAGLRVAPMQPGSTLFADATGRFYVDANEGNVLHYGGEAGAVLTQHVEAAAAVKTEMGWRISKVRSARPIDALIAMVMSHSRAVQGMGSVYERRGLRSVGHDDEDEE